MIQTKGSIVPAEALPTGARLGPIGERTDYTSTFLEPRGHFSEAQVCGVFGYSFFGPSNLGLLGVSLSGYALKKGFIGERRRNR